MVPFEQNLCEAFSKGEVGKHWIRKVIKALYETFYLSYPVGDVVGEKTRRSAVKLLQDFDEIDCAGMIAVEPLRSYALAAEKRLRAQRLE